MLLPLPSLNDQLLADVYYPVHQPPTRRSLLTTRYTHSYSLTDLYRTTWYARSLEFIPRLPPTQWHWKSSTGYMHA